MWASAGGGGGGGGGEEGGRLRGGPVGTPIFLKLNYSTQPSIFTQLLCTCLSVT